MEKEEKKLRATAAFLTSEIKSTPVVSPFDQVTLLRHACIDSLTLSAFLGHVHTRDISKTRLRESRETRNLVSITASHARITYGECGGCGKKPEPHCTKQNEATTRHTGNGPQMVFLGCAKKCFSLQSHGRGRRATTGSSFFTSLCRARARFSPKSDAANEGSDTACFSSFPSFFSCYLLLQLECVTGFYREDRSRVEVSNPSNPHCW